MGAILSVVSRVIRWGLPFVLAVGWLIGAAAAKDSILTNQENREELVWSIAGLILFLGYTLQALLEKWGPVAWFCGFVTLVFVGLSIYYAV